MHAESLAASRVDILEQVEGRIGPLVQAGQPEEGVGEQKAALGARLGSHSSELHTA